MNRFASLLPNIDVEPNIYNVCCHILRYFRINNGENPTERLARFLEPLMKGTKDEICGKIIINLKDKPKNQGEIPLFLSFKEVLDLLNASVSSDSKLSDDDLQQLCHKHCFPIILHHLVSKNYLKDYLDYFSKRFHNPESTIEALKSDFCTNCFFFNHQLLKDYDVQLKNCSFNQNELNSLLREFVFEKKTEIFGKELEKYLENYSSFFYKINFETFVDILQSLESEQFDIFDFEKKVAEAILEKINKL